MAGIKISKVIDKSFGSCVKMENGLVELMVTTDFGPRVISFSRTGMENMLYQDPDKQKLGDPYEIYEGDQISLYGGHRIWVSPEEVPRCYYPDNHPVTCTEIENGMEFAAPVEKWNNIQKILSITLMEDAPIVKLAHTVKNCGTWDVEFAPWCITMTDKGGKLVIPMPDRKTGYLCNRNISLWDYSAMNDERVYWGKDYITLTQNPGIAQPFKLGINNEAGWGACFNKGQVMIKFFEPVPGGLYPDNGCCFEAYTNDVMLEVESLGEFVCLQPDETVTHEEEWEIYEAPKVPSNDEEEIRTIMEEYL